MSTHICAVIYVSLQRLPRQPCGQCCKRRVLYVLTVSGERSGPAFCAGCAGLR